MSDCKTCPRIVWLRIFRWRSYSDEPGSDARQARRGKLFFGYLEETQDLPQAQTQTPFRYHLSAFLGATYSVDQYLQTEVVSAMRQQARIQGKKLSDQQKGKHSNKLFVQWFTALPQEKQALWGFLMNNRGNEIHVERTKTVTKGTAMSTPLIEGFPYRSERNSAFGAHYVMQQQWPSSMREHRLSSSA